MSVVINVWFLVAITVFSLLCIFVTVRMYCKVAILENINEEYGVQLENYISFFLDFQEKVVGGMVRLKKVDDKGAFSSDDEVGFAFTIIQSVFDDLVKIFSHYIYEEDKKEK